MEYYTILKKKRMEPAIYNMDKPKRHAKRNKPDTERKYRISHLYVKSEIESRKVVARSGGREKWEVLVKVSKVPAP